MLALALTVPLLLYVVGALLATGPRWRRILCFLPASSGFLAPFAMPEDWRVGRSLLTLFAIGALLRGTDLVMRREPTSPLRRLAHALLLVDSSSIRRVPRSFDPGAAVRVVVFAAMAFAGRELAFDLAPAVASHSAGAALAVRWLGGLLYVYGVSDTAYGSLTLFGRGIGFAFPAIHRDPALSRSVRELWGRRWNRVVGAWLEVHLHRPMARLGHPGLGMVLAFLFSAALHVYAALPALGAKWGAIVGGYFIVQGLLALLEGPLHVARWRPWQGHTWVLVVMGGTSPLFCEAFLRVVAP